MAPASLRSLSLIIVYFIKYPLQDELRLARRKRERCYSTMIHFLYLGTQVWQNDWHMYEKPGIRVNVWAEIQLNVFKFFASNIHALEQGRLRCMFYSYFSQIAR